MATKVWAHRGASAYAPENTIAAFKLAMEMGADGIELDVQMTSDDKLVVIHDETIDRTSNGTGRVIDHTCQELKALDFSNGFEQYKGTRIPTLKEVYGLVKNTDMMVNVEVKCDAIMYWGIWTKLIALERETGMQGRILYSSFNHYVLLKLREIDPCCKIGLLYAGMMVDPWVYANYVKADAIHPYKDVLLYPGLVEGCREHGVDVNLWTVDEPEDIRTAIRSGVSAVITNRPDIAARQITG